MGQKSCVDRLSPELREKLLELLNNPAVTQAEIVDAINAEAGEPLISKSCGRQRTKFYRLNVLSARTRFCYAKLAINGVSAWINCKMLCPQNPTTSFRKKTRADCRTRARYQTPFMQSASLFGKVRKRYPKQTRKGRKRADTPCRIRPYSGT